MKTFNKLQILSFVILVLVPFSSSWGVTFADDVTISAEDLSYDGQDIVVDGVTLTVSGTHSFSSLELSNGAMLTHPTNDERRLSLIVSGPMKIDSTSSINVSGRGYGQAAETSGRVGGSHGGRGGAYNSSLSSLEYGSYAEPNDFGYGGGLTRGGGAIHLTADELIIDGRIVANGMNQSGTTGAGAGGSIWLHVNRLSGDGSIKADGGIAFSNRYGGGGGGGRVSIYYHSLDDFSQEAITALGGGGGANSEAGSPGTIYLENLSTGHSELMVKGSGLISQATTIRTSATNINLVNISNAKVEFVSENLATGGSVFANDSHLILQGVHSFNSLDILNGSTVTHPVASGNKLNITVVGGVNIDENSSIDVSGKGWGRATGVSGRVGGSHGGRGGAYRSSDSIPEYGNFTEPTDYGYGGELVRGGGAIRLVANELVLDGQIVANGTNQAGTTGAGAGGSIWLQANSLSGTGVIRANGGNAYSNRYGGGGGGGRVAIYYQSFASFSQDRVSALGGLGGASSDPGTAGTIYFNHLAQSSAKLLVKGNGYLSLPTTVTTQASSPLSVIFDNAHVQMKTKEADLHEVASLELTGGAVLSHATGSSVKLEINSLGLVSVDEQSSINLNGRGYGEKDPVSVSSRAGGSHGGRGGAYNSSASSPEHGSYATPTGYGYGGGSTRGGGAIHLTAEELVLNGQIVANGTDQSGTTGAGAGGSIWLNINSLSGVGSIEANGGNAYSNYYGGGGGGGRVAIYYQSLEDFSQDSVTALGGQGGANSNNGGAGTVYFFNLLTEKSELVVRGSGTGSQKTTIRNLATNINSIVIRDAKVEFALDDLAAGGSVLSDGGYLVLNGNHTFNSLDVLNGSTLTHPVNNNNNLKITVAGLINIDENSSINVSGKGHGMAPVVSGRAGGSHGGRGGAYGSSQSIPVYGSYAEPTDYGYGGGSTRGGGAVHLIADGLVLDGQIVANGVDQSGTTGAGAGGSIWLNVNSLSGSGSIGANGGNAYSNYYGGGGGGGRVAVYYQSLEDFPPGGVTALGGQGGASSEDGEDGTIHLVARDNPILKTVSVRRTTVPDNGNENLTEFDVSFWSPIDAASFQASDISLASGSNTAVVTNIVQINSLTYRVFLQQPLEDGDYQMTIGPDIQTEAGMGMDQNWNGILGEAEDIYRASFSIDSQPPEAVEITSHDVNQLHEIDTREITIEGLRNEEVAVWINGEQQVAINDTPWIVEDYPLEEGLNQLTVIAVDVAQNQSTPIVLQVDIDSVDPAYVGIDPSGHINETPEVILLEASDTGSGLSLENTSVQVKSDGQVVPGTLELDGNVFTFTPGSQLVEGTYSVLAGIGDMRGNVRRGISEQLVIDFTTPAAPQVSAYPPVTTINTYTFSGTKESYSGVVLDGVQVVSNGSSETWTKTQSLVEGVNTFTFQLIDRAGNFSEPTEVTIRYDDTVPGQVAFSINPEGDGTSVSLDWSSYDTVANGNDIAKYHMFAAPAPFTSAKDLAALATIPAGTTSFKLDDLPRNAPVYVAVVAEDTSGLMLDEVNSIETTPVDIEPPSNPADLTVSPGSDNIAIAWTPVPDKANDLAGYRLYVQGDGEGDTYELPLESVNTEGGLVVFDVSSLQPATGYQLRVTAYDGDGNESAGVSKTGVTLLQNPALTSTEPFSGKVELEWSPAVPLGLVKQYRVYASMMPYTSVKGMTPRATFSSDKVSGGVAGLENGTTYYVAVTVVNLSDGEDPRVTTLEVTPEEDVEGPEIQKVAYYDGNVESELVDGATVTQVGTVRVYAEDPSGLSSLELSVDGANLGTDHSASPFFEVPWNLIDFTDGEHVLTATAHDTLNNTSERVLTLNVALAPPAAPEILTPETGSTTNRSEIEVTGQSVEQTDIQITVNGTLQPDIIPANTQGQFKVTVPLTEGENSITVAAAYRDRGVYGDSSAPVNITLDSTAPDAPQGLTAQSKPLGQIALGWSSVDKAEGYRIYRATEPFDVAQGITLLTGEAHTGTTYQDLPGEDGEYYYRVIAVNKLGTESEPSASASATSDSTAPQATKIRYTPHGSHDPATGRYGPGQIDVEVEVSEALKTTPYLALTVSGGLPMVAELRKDYNSDTLYTGGFVIPETAISGTAMAVFSAHDKVGNRGTEVLEGSTLIVDAKGPEVSQLTLNPSSPIQNDPDENGLGRTLEVSLTLADDVMAGETPQLIPVIVTENGEEVIADYASGITLTQDPASQPGNPVYTGQFQLPVSAGQDSNGDPTSELLGFRYLARDDLGNEIDRIAGNPRFQVYQGDLPPVETPTGLMARALPGGKVELIWSDVEDAAGYRIYRQAPGESDLTERAELDYPAEMRYLDGEGSPLLDGQYQYAIASIRAQNGQTSESAMSDPVSVNADATPPDAPENLSLELNGAGVVARWQPPASEVQDGLLEYNLYRVDLPADSQPMDMLAYTPYQNGIPDIIALDSRPSDTEHLYVVTAVDAAGNESVASNAEYLNVDLLPVSDLNITLAEGGQPTLSWDHSKASAVAFEVYDANASEDVPLHEGTVADRQYVDGSYSTAEEGGAPTDRLYRVVAVDTNGVASVGHDLLLPALSTSLNRDESGIDLRRGIMNRASFRVSNAGASNVVQARLRVIVDDNGTAREHFSERFSVDPGGFTDVPVVIGGYDALPTLAPMAVDILLMPKAGQSITIQQSEEIQVGQSGLVATLEAEDFVRGATGKVRLMLENPSDVETEVLMARSSGKQASNELRLTLKDHDGNTLSEQAVQQATGDVITLSNGATVARIPPNGTYRSQPLEIPVPSSAPNSVRVHLLLDHVRYHTGRDTYVAIEGTRASRDVSLKETPYYGELAEITPATVFTGDTVTIKGQAMDRQSDTVLPNVPLTLVLTTRGFERTFPVYTGADGAFSYTFTPGASESGEYRVSVLHPRMVERPEHGTFTVEGAGVTPTRAEINIPRNYEYELKIRVKAGHATELENVRLAYAPSADSEGNPLPAPQGMQYNLGAPKQVQANQTAYLPLTFSGDASAADEGKLRFHVVADNGAQPLDTVTVNYFLSEARPVMLAQPSLVNTGVSLGQSQQETFTLENTGLESAYNLNLSLVTENGDSAPDWFQLLSPANIGSLAVGNTAEVQVALSPDAQVPPNDYVFMVRVAGDNIDTFNVPVLVAATNADTGSVFFHTTDIYTATLDEDMNPIPGLGNVKIKLQNTKVLSEEFELKTDADGFGELKDIPAGRYAYRASAFDHESVSGHLWVKPGVTTDEQLFLMNKLVNVEFSVTEITLEDRYDIVLEATYETNVPAPVVLFEPMSVNLPMLKKGEVFQGEFTLSNHGLIEAYDVTANLPTGDDYARFDYLTEIPDTLAPGQVVRVPYRIVALQDFEPSGDGEATGGGCLRREYRAVCDYSAQCAVGSIIQNVATMIWNATAGDSCGGSSGGGGGYWGGYGGYGGYGGGGTTYVPAPRKFEGTAEQFCPSDDECAGKGGNQGGGG